MLLLTRLFCHFSAGSASTQPNGLQALGDLELGPILRRQRGIARSIHNKRLHTRFLGSSGLLDIVTQEQDPLRIRLHPKLLRNLLIALPVHLRSRIDGIEVRFEQRIQIFRASRLSLPIDTHMPKEHPLRLHTARAKHCQPLAPTVSPCLQHTHDIREQRRDDVTVFVARAPEVALKLLEMRCFAIGVRERGDVLEVGG